MESRARAGVTAFLSADAFHLCLAPPRGGALLPTASWGQRSFPAYCAPAVALGRIHGTTGDLGQEVGDGDDEISAGVGGLLGDLPRSVERVGRGGDGAERGDDEEVDRVEEGVGREEEHGVAAADADAGGECGGRGEHRGAEGPEDERTARRGVHERRRGGARGSAPEDEVDEGER